MHCKCVVLQNEMYPVVGWQWILFWLTVIRALFNWEQNVHVIARVCQKLLLNVILYWKHPDNSQVLWSFCLNQLSCELCKICISGTERKDYLCSLLILHNTCCFSHLSLSTSVCLCCLPDCNLSSSLLYIPPVLNSQVFELVLFRLWPRMWIFFNSWELKARQALKHVVIGLIKGRESHSEVLLIISRQMIF